MTAQKPTRVMSVERGEIKSNPSIKMLHAIEIPVDWNQKYF